MLVPRVCSDGTPLLIYLVGVRMSPILQNFWDSTSVISLFAMMRFVDFPDGMPQRSEYHLPDPTHFTSHRRTSITCPSANRLQSVSGGEYSANRDMRAFFARPDDDERSEVVRNPFISPRLLYQEDESFSDRISTSAGFVRSNPIRGSQCQVTSPEVKHPPPYNTEIQSRESENHQTRLMYCPEGSSSLSRNRNYPIASSIETLQQQIHSNIPSPTSFSYFSTYRNQGQSESPNGHASMHNLMPSHLTQPRPWGGNTTGATERLTHDPSYENFDGISSSDAYNSSATLQRMNNSNWLREKDAHEVSGESYGSSQEIFRWKTSTFYFIYKRNIQLIDLRVFFSLQVSWL